jgi:hypothetical protein
VSQLALIDEAALRPVEIVELSLDGPPLRCVYWLSDNELASDRVCLVRCDDGERSMLRIRSLDTLCGVSCKDIVRTSGIPPAKQPYCQACAANAGRGVLK